MPVVLALRGGAAVTVSMSFLLCLWQAGAQDPPSPVRPPTEAASDPAASDPAASDPAASESASSESSSAPAAEPPLLDPAGLVAQQQRDAMLEDILSLRGMLGAAFSNEEEEAMFRQALESFEPPPAPPAAANLEIPVPDDRQIHVPDAENQGPLLLAAPARQVRVEVEVAAQLRTAARMMDEEAYRAAEQGASSETAMAYRKMATKILLLSLELSPQQR